jgi:hypothetical protein
LVLLASALKLLNVPSVTLGILLVVVVLVGLPAWGALDAARHPEGMWKRAGLDRSKWIRLQVLTAPLGAGLVIAAVYFARVRSQLIASAPPGMGGAFPTAAEPVG